MKDREEHRDDDARWVKLARSRRLKLDWASPDDHLPLPACLLDSLGLGREMLGHGGVGFHWHSSSSSSSTPCVDSINRIEFYFGLRFEHFSSVAKIHLLPKARSLASPKIPVSSWVSLVFALTGVFKILSAWVSLTELETEWSLQSEIWLDHHLHLLPAPCLLDLALGFYFVDIHHMLIQSTGLNLFWP